MVHPSELVETGESLQQAVDHIPVIVFALDRNGTFILSEGKGLEVLGLRPGQNLGRSVYDVYRNDPAVLDLTGRALAGEEVTSMAEVPPGSGILWQTHLRPRRDETGALQGMIGIVFNVSQRPPSAITIRLLEERLRTVIEHAPVVLFAFDRSGLVTLSEGLGLAGMGFRPGELVGRSVYDLYPEQTEAIERALRGEGFTTTQRLGSVWLRACFLPLRDPLGNVEGSTGVAVDVTELIEAQQSLERQGRLLGLLSELAAAANRASSFEEAVQTCLDRVCAFTGWPLGHAYRPDPIDPELLRPTGLWHIDDPAAFAPLRELTERIALRRGMELPGRVYETGATLWSEDVTVAAGPSAARLGVELGVRAAFAFPVLASREVAAVLEFFSASPAPPDRPLLDAMAHVGTLLGRVAERARAERDRELLLAREVEARAAAERAVRLRDEFLSIASHELRTPLSSLVLSIQSLQRLDDLGGIARAAPHLVERALETANRQTRRLTALLDTLLDVSRIQAGRLTLDRAPADLAEIAREVVELFSEQAGAKHSQLELRAGPPVPGCWDRGRVEQALCNLIENALKYGEGRPVQVEVSSDGQAAHVVVTDQGIGIDPERLPFVFERFERAVSSRHFGGLGLGLYIVREVAAAHGGTVTVESRHGQGSTFRLTLPATEQDPGA